MSALSITSPPETDQAGLVSVEIFTYICFVVVLLANPDKHRAIALLRFLGDLIPSTAPVHRHLIAVHLVMVDLELLLTGQPAIVLLRKHQRLQDTGCLYTFHSFHLPRPPARSERSPFFREMISEQTACKRQSAANAHCTGCTPVIPCTSYSLADFQINFKQFLGRAQEILP